MESEVTSWHNVKDMCTEYHVKVYDSELARVPLDNFDKRVVFDPIEKASDVPYRQQFACPLF